MNSVELIQLNEFCWMISVEWIKLNELLPGIGADATPLVGMEDLESSAQRSGAIHQPDAGRPHRATLLYGIHPDSRIRTALQSNNQFILGIFPFHLFWLISFSLMLSLRVNK